MEIKEQDPRIKELLLHQRITQKINSILDLDKLLEEIVGDVLETFGYTRSGILFIDKETNELEIAAVRGWTINYHVKGERFKIGEYGIVGHVAETGKTHYASDVSTDPYYQVSEKSTNSEIDIPLKIHGKVIGVFNVQHNKLNAFSKERIQMLETLACDISIAIENARLFQKERFEKERMLDELSEARKTQFNLFPKDPPSIPGFIINGICLPCSEVGGDWFDYIPLNNGRLGIVLADVSGKGMGAALLMSSTRSILRLVANANNSPGEVLKQVNDILLRDFPHTKFVTMIYGVLDPIKQTFVFANAGHLYPLFVEPAFNDFLKTTNGIPLGITESSFTECKIDFSNGSRLLFYTDGVTEAMNKSLEEFGTERLKKHFKNPSASIQSIINKIHDFAGGYSLCDDVTLVMIELDSK
jgi:phosphoserine phosphatase RsbU/P